MKSKKNIFQKQIFQDLIDLSEKFDFRVIHDKGNFSGDHCLLETKNYVVLNKHHPLEQKIHILVTYYNSFDLEKIYLKPRIRKFLENYS